MSDEGHEYRYPPEGAAQLLTWDAGELPARFHATRRAAVVELLDDAVRLFSQHGRPAERIEDGPWTGGSWQFEVAPDQLLVLGVTPEGLVGGRIRQRHRMERDVPRFDFVPQFDVVSGRLVGSPVLTGGGQPLRDLRNPGHPRIMCSPLEDLVSAILGARFL